MIGRHIPAPPMAGPIFRYLISGRQMRVVGGDPRSMACLCPRPDQETLARRLAVSFESTRSLRPEVPSPFRHLVFSADVGESLPWADIIPTIAAAHGLNSVQHRYLAVEHFDRNFEHIHFVFERVGNDGSLLRDRLRDCAISQAVCRQVEREYGLRVLKSSVSLDEMKSLRRPKSRKKRESRGEYEIHLRGEPTRKDIALQRLHAVWPKSGEVLSFADFVARLAQARIELLVNKRGSRVGLSYRFDGEEIWNASTLSQGVLWTALEPHISTQISTEDISRIRAARPRTAPKPPPIAALPVVAPTHVPEHEVPPSKPFRPHLNPPAVNLLDLLDEAYASISRSSAQAEAARQRVSGPSVPRNRPASRSHPLRSRSNPWRR